MKSDTENIGVYLRKMFLNFCQNMAESENLSEISGFFRSIVCSRSTPVLVVDAGKSSGWGVPLLSGIKKKKKYGPLISTSAAGGG